MTEFKAYSCMETEEYIGAVIFAKSNLEARKIAANEFNDGHLGGLTVKRAPWADEFGARHLIPISVMVDHGWHFECTWSGITIDSNLYEYGYDWYNPDTKEYEIDASYIGQKPVGFQESVCFAIQEYADKWKEAKRLEKEFNEKQIKIYQNYVLSKLPDAVLINEEGYGRSSRITSCEMKTFFNSGLNERYIRSFDIPFSFPGMQHWAALKFDQQPGYYHQMGPIKPHFICANGDVEAFNAWAAQQKEKIKK